VTTGQRRVRFASRRLLIAAIVAALSFSAGSMFVAYGNSAGETYYGCIKTNGGTLYNVNTTAELACKNGDTPVSWNQEGPQGLQGPAGAQGEQGVPGDAGATGPMGPQGDQGPMGPVGPQGEPGPVGPTGPQGPQGLQGPVGATGPQGPSGLAGLQWVSVTRSYGPLEYFTTVDATCPSGKVAISGGYSKNPSAEVSQSAPILNSQNVATGWRVFAEMPTLDIHGEWSVTAFALCANAS
jgi:hypothetical protein